MKNEKITINQVDVYIEPLRRYVAEIFTPEISQNLYLEMRQIIDRMGTQIVAMVDLPLEPLETFSELAILKTPKTWFDFFRLTYFPNFLTHKFPIKFHTERQQINVKCGAVYPKLPVAFPKFGGSIRYSYMSRPSMSSYPTIDED